MKRVWDEETKTYDRRLTWVDSTLQAVKRRVMPFRSTSSWSEALKKCFGAEPEGDVGGYHPPEVRAAEFECLDAGTTELEVLELLHALARVFKPATVVETGTFRGFGTLTFAHALACNGKGRVKTIDRDPEAFRIAKRHIKVFDRKLLDRVSFISGESRAELRKLHQGEVGLAFLDSTPSVRVSELEILLEQGLMAPNGIVVLHDTQGNYSGSVAQPDVEMKWEGLDRLHQLALEHGAIWSRLSRGFVMIQPRDCVGPR